MVIENILAKRYVSKEIKEIWSEKNRIIEERKFWVNALDVYKNLGLNISDKDIANYKKNIDNVDLKSIENRERNNLHDIKAKIEEFNSISNAKGAHLGWTSRDLSENIDFIQIYRSLEILKNKCFVILNRFSEIADEYKDTVICGKTHNVAAQLTTLGRRFAMFGEEFGIGLNNLCKLEKNLRTRGIKGAVGTQLDLMTLFDGDAKKVRQFEKDLFKKYHNLKIFNACGQVYPRSQDFQLASLLVNISSSLANFAKNIRLMAGNGQINEGFKENQVGSSAMPHKMNARNCERINGLFVILKSCQSMLADLTGEQWNEGDVTCSVVRRFALPNTFFSFDAILETTYHVLNNFKIFSNRIDSECQDYLPFLLSSKFLNSAVKKDNDREKIHKIIKKYSNQIYQDFVNNKCKPIKLLDKLAESDQFPLSKEDLLKLYQVGQNEVGLAKENIKDFIKFSDKIISKYSCDNNSLNTKFYNPI